MDRRLDEWRGSHIVHALETMTGRDVPETVRRELTSGARELDIVRTGLDDTMRHAFGEIRQVLAEEKSITDYRTAAFVVSLRKIAHSYIEMGF